MTPPLPSTDELGLDEEARRVDQLAREVLGDNYVHFTLGRLEVTEDPNAPDGERVSLTCQLARSGNGGEVALEGRGVGLIDAFFDGMMRAYAEEYPSLKTLAVSDFAVTSRFDGAQGRRSDARAHASLEITNSQEQAYTFVTETPSLTRSAARVSLDALTFFINSERAYIQLHLALMDAKERRRSDLVTKYRTQMSTLVSATSYSEVIERIKAEADK